MPKISGAAELQKRVKGLQELSERLEVKVLEKRRWLDKQDEKYLESSKGMEWEAYLDYLDDLLTDITSIRLEQY